MYEIDTNDMVEAQTFHVFTDASQDVYATLVFGRNQRKDGTSSTLLAVSQ